MSVVSGSAVLLSPSVMGNEDRAAGEGEDGATEAAGGEEGCAVDMLPSDGGGLTGHDAAAGLAFKRPVTARKL